MKKTNCILCIAVAIAMFFGLQNVVLATPCGSGGVSGATDCQDGLSNNDFPAPATVNNEMFFNFDDWSYLNKYDVTENAYDQGTAFDWNVFLDTGITGSWSFNASVWDTYSNVMLVVKTGKNKTPYGDVFFSGYLLDSALQPVSGTWGSGTKDLSHFTLYARGGNAPVPEPATMLLFGAGMAGLAGTRLRKNKK